MPAKINLIGQRFGKLKVIEETPIRKNNSIVWTCQCDCGNIENFSTKELRSDGLIQCHNCGSNREPITNRAKYIGKIINGIEILEKTGKRSGGKIIYKCKCFCGNIFECNITDIQSGHTKSCGCLRRKYQIGDIINNREILDISNKKNKNRNIYYRCKCLLCGNIYDALAQVIDNTISCGCQRSKGEFNISKLLQENDISYKKEFMFPNTLYRFDFAIINNDNQIIRLVEFDGEQHYESGIRTSGWNTYKKYEYTLQNDLIKNKIARENDTPLVRIPYWERDNITLDIIFGDKYLIS